MGIVKIIMKVILLPVRICLTIIQLVFMFVIWLSATVFHILSGNYLYHSNIKLWIRARDRYRSAQNAFGWFCALCPACTLRLGGRVAGNNQNQFKRRLSRWK